MEVQTENDMLTATVEPDSDLKNFLVEYTGDKLNPEDQNVTVEMIIEVVATEFPEFLMAVAEENYFRGYQQALNDADEGEKLYKEFMNMYEENGEHHDKPKPESN